MRRFPSSWTDTLTSLGLRRRVRRDKGSRRSRRFEKLEDKVVLSANPVFATAIEPQYVIVGGSGQQYFDLQPADDGQSAVLALREGATAPVDEKLTVLVEKQLGGYATERVEVVVDLVEQDFLDRFYADRVGQSLEVASASDPGPVDPIGPLIPGDGPAAAAFASPFAAFAMASSSEPTLEDLLLEASEADDLSSAEAKRLYEQLVTASVEVPESGGADIEQATFGDAALLLSERLSDDLQSEDAALAAEARELRDRLASDAHSYYTLWTGLGINHVIRDAEIGSQGNYTFALYEQGTFGLADGLSIDVGREASIESLHQSAFGSSMGIRTAALMASLPVTQDTTLTNVVGTQNWYQADTAYALNTDPSSSYEALFGFDVSTLAGQTIQAADATVRTTFSFGGNGNELNAADASFLRWNETTVGWDDRPDLAFGPEIETWTPALGDKTIDLTEAVRRATRYGDANLDGVYDNNDIAAFYTSVVYPGQYDNEYAIRGSYDSEAAHSVDSNWDNIIDGSDVTSFFARHGQVRGDFNLDGISDSADYDIWIANFGSPTPLYSTGDGNFDGLINAADYTVWLDSDGQTATSPESPLVSLRISDVSAIDESAVVGYATRDNTDATKHPVLNFTKNPDFVVKQFSAEDGDLQIAYSVVNEAFASATVEVWRSADGVTLDSMMMSHTLAAGDLTTGHHSVSFGASFTNDIDEDYQLVARVVGTTTSGAAEHTDSNNSSIFAGGAFKENDGTLHVHGGEGADQIEVAAREATVYLEDGTKSSVFLGQKVDFSDFTLANYGNQTNPVGGNTPVSEVLDDGETLLLENNSWQAISLPVTITADTVIEFDYESTAEGEMHGFGFDTDLGLTTNHIFRLHGTQGIHPTWTVIDAPYQVGSGTRHYKISIGQLTNGQNASHLGSYNQLFFFADNDFGGTGNAKFSNVRIYENTSTNLPRDAYVRSHGGNDEILAGGLTSHVFPGVGADAFGTTAERGLALVHESAGDDTYRFDADASGEVLLVADESGSNLGFDTIDFSLRGSGVNFDLGSHELQVNEDLGIAIAKSIPSAGQSSPVIERLIGSPFDDTLSGDALANVILGGPGNDEIQGGGGADTLDGQQDADSFTGSPADLVDDTLLDLGVVGTPPLIQTADGAVFEVFAGENAEVQLQAADPDGLVFLAASALPETAVLGTDGVFSWTPNATLDAGQEFQVDYVVHDLATPIGVSAASFVVRVIDRYIVRPSAPTIEILGATGAFLRWVPDEQATSYEVERSEDGGSWQTVGTVTSDNAYTDNTLKPGSTYDYRVRYEFASGSDVSAEAGFTAPMNAPVITLAEGEDGRNDRFDVSWDYDSGSVSYPDPTGFYVEYIDPSDFSSSSGWIRRSSSGSVRSRTSIDFSTAGSNGQVADHQVLPSKVIGVRVGAVGEAGVVSWSSPTIVVTDPVARQVDKDFLGLDHEITGIPVGASQIGSTWTVGSDLLGSNSTADTGAADRTRYWINDTNNSTGVFGAYADTTDSVFKEGTAFDGSYRHEFRFATTRINSKTSDSGQTKGSLYNGPGADLALYGLQWSSDDYYLNLDGVFGTTSAAEPNELLVPSSSFVSLKSHDYLTSHPAYGGANGTSNGVRASGNIVYAPIDLSDLGVPLGARVPDVYLRGSSSSDLLGLAIIATPAEYIVDLVSGQVADQDEVSEGAFVSVNKDRDEGNATAGGNPVLDNELHEGSVSRINAAADPHLTPVRLDLMSNAAVAGEYRLDFENNIKVWRRDGELYHEVTPGERIADLSSDEGTQQSISGNRNSIDLLVEGVTTSDAMGVTLQARFSPDFDAAGITGEYTAASSRDRLALTVFDADIGVAGVSEVGESTYGVYLGANTDDDDADGVPDRRDTAVSGGDDDLMPITLPALSNSSGASRALRYDPQRIVVWDSPTKQNRIDAGDTFSASTTHTFYVEGVSTSDSLGDAKLSSVLIPNGSTSATPEVISDTVRITVVPDAALVSNTALPTLEDLLSDEDGDGRVLVDELLSGTDPLIDDLARQQPLDSDGDGISDSIELLIDTDPAEFDTDGDLLGDGFEYSSGVLDPLAVDDALADPDQDGLSHLDEQRFGLDPFNPDTDGDSVGDAQEKATNATKFGETISLELAIGDHSGSDSERYEMVIRRLDGTVLLRHEAEEFGKVEEKVFADFKIGETYTVEVIWKETRVESGEPDYDYTATIKEVGLPEGDDGRLYFDDPDGLLGEHEESTFNFADGKMAKFTVLGIDLDVDSDNRGGIQNSAWEEELEDNPYGMPYMIRVQDGAQLALIRLPTGLDPNDPRVRVRIRTDILNATGGLIAINSDFLSATNGQSEVPDGDTDGIDLPLSDLNYDPNTGVTAIYLNATRAGLQSTLEQLDTRGTRREGMLSVQLVIDDSEVEAISDRVKLGSYDISSDPDTFFFGSPRSTSILYDIVSRPEVRAGLASTLSYQPGGSRDRPGYGLREISPADMVELGLEAGLILDITSDLGAPGFAAAMFQDYSAGPDQYILAFRGTDNLPDWGDNITQGFGFFSPQYDRAMSIANSLVTQLPEEASFVITGHSLGGGLASAAAVVADTEAITFNSAGLSRFTIQNAFPAALDRYDNASRFITAYQVDYDILTNVQVALPGIPNAIGFTRPLDSPHDTEILLDSAFFVGQAAVGAGWGALLNAADAVLTMVEAHGDYLYGLLVVESFAGTTRVLDTWGYPDN